MDTHMDEMLRIIAELLEEDALDRKRETARLDGILRRAAELREGDGDGA